MNRNFNSHDYEYRLFCARKPSLAYDGSVPFAAWQSIAKEKLTELLGLPLETCDADLQIAYTREFSDHTEYRFTVQTEPGYYVPCHLLIPKDTEDRIPLTICLSGHGSGMHIALGAAKNKDDEATLAEWPHRALAPRSIKEHRAALVVEARCFGESSINGYGTSCTETAKIAILAGRTIIGERVWDVMRILDVLFETFEGLDADDIVCTGNSGGGTATFYLACLDERIRCAAPSCSICNYEASIAAMPHCMCNHIPSIRKYFEMADLAGLIAPRRLVIAAGVEDRIFPKEGTQQTFARIRELYAAANAPDACTLVWGDGGHYNYADLLWEEINK
ncbi:MAG: hypothetical protein IKZ09_11725 [Clostridia bacterium]|nr:hypothetical protein [Clostridia bacterium]